jgi:hypothetical protein
LQRIASRCAAAEAVGPLAAIASLCVQNYCRRLTPGFALDIAQPREENTNEVSQPSGQNLLVKSCLQAAKRCTVTGIARLIWYVCTCVSVLDLRTFEL